MTKGMTLSFGSLVLLTTLYGVLIDSALISYILDTDTISVAVRASLILLVSAYCFMPTVRLKVFQKAMIGLGIILVSMPIIGLFAPGLLEIFGINLRLLDIFFAIEWGIVTLLVALEQPTRVSPDIAADSFGLHHTPSHKSSTFRPTTA